MLWKRERASMTVRLCLVEGKTLGNINSQVLFSCLA